MDFSNPKSSVFPEKYYCKVELLRASMKIVFILMFGFTLTIATGCAPILISISTPEIQTVENSYYSAQFKPLKEGQNPGHHQLKLYLVYQPC